MEDSLGYNSSHFKFLKHQFKVVSYEELLRYYKIYMKLYHSYGAFNGSTFKKKISAIVDLNETPSIKYDLFKKEIILGVEEYNKIHSSQPNKQIVF